MKTLTFLLLLLSAPVLVAAEITGGDYQGREDVAAFIRQMAAETDYTEAELVALFSQVEKQGHLFDKLDRPAEKELDWYQYRGIFIKDQRIERGVDFWRRHSNQLAEVSEQTGVPPEIIVAIIGVETFYGTY